MVQAPRRVQIGQETVRGTSVAADAILLGRLTMTPTPNWYKPQDEERNSLALNHRLTNVGQQNNLSYEGSLTFEQVGHWLSMGVGALTTSQPDSGGSPNVYEHTFEPTLSALAAQKAYTVEYGDNQQEYESAFMMAAALEFSYAIGEPWQISADLFARFPSKSTFTGALTPPTVEDVIGQKTKVYIDSSWANLGNTQVSSTLINAKVGGNTGLVPTRYSDGDLEFSDVAENPWASQVELMFKEWKSYANLRKFDTGNEHIAAGLIWASLAAAILKRFLAHATQKARRCAISTRKVAMCARVFLRQLLAALTHPQQLREMLATVVDFLDHNARRADVKRDRRRGRLSVGLELCGVAK